MSHVQKYKMLWTRTSFAKNIADIHGNSQMIITFIKKCDRKIVKTCVRITKCEKGLFASYQKLKEINY